MTSSSDLCSNVAEGRIRSIIRSRRSAKDEGQNAEASTIDDRQRQHHTPINLRLLVCQHDHDLDSTITWSESFFGGSQKTDPQYAGAGIGAICLDHTPCAVGRSHSLEYGRDPVLSERLCSFGCATYGRKCLWIATAIHVLFLRRPSRFHHLHHLVN